jgi:hypothetical protein
MLLAPGLSSYGFKYDNWGANPSATMGTSVIPGASNAEGSWTQIASSADISADCYWLFITVHSGNTSAQQKDHLIDIGVDPAGGSSYAAVVSNIVCGLTVSSPGAGYRFTFPLFVKSGSSVAVRAQGNNATAGTVRVMAKFYGQPSNPEAVPVGQFSETIGAITNSQGVGFTPGNAADGSWQSLGTTTSALWWWQLAFQVSDSTMTAELAFIDLAYGDATNKTNILRLCHASTSTTESAQENSAANVFFADCFCPVPSGATIYVRGRCSDAPDTGYNAVAIGIGG